MSENEEFFHGAMKALRASTVMMEHMDHIYRRHQEALKYITEVGTALSGDDDRGDLTVEEVLGLLGLMHAKLQIHELSADGCGVPGCKHCEEDGSGDQVH